MKPLFGMSLNPSDYALELVKRLDFKEPSLEWVDIVIEHLGLRKRQYSGSLFFLEDEGVEDDQGSVEQRRLFDHVAASSAPPGRQHRRRPIDAALLRKTVVVDSEFPLSRQRLAVCHEIGHYCLPWHEGLTFLKDGCIVEPTGTKWYELEAHRFAADLLMPPLFFREDMDNLPFGLDSVEMLSSRYLTSLEATARHYVDLSRRSCALVIVEALPNRTANQNGASLKVRYSHRSRSFNHFIRPGTEVASGSPITQASLGQSGLTITDEVPGGVLGLRPERRLILHCQSWGKEGDVLVLVEEHQGNQGTLL